MNPDDKCNCGMCPDNENCNCSYNSNCNCNINQNNRYFNEMCNCDISQNNRDLSDNRECNNNRNCDNDRDCSNNRNCNEKCDCGMCPKKMDCACICKYEFELNDMNNNENEATMEELAKQLKCLRFAIIELGLYLDTHPDDKKAICLHNEYAKKFKTLSDQYQKLYGPLSIMFPCNKWRWLESPWPWEGECK